MDTVPLCRGAKPIVKGKRIISEGKTGLGGDDRSGCAAIVTLAETLLSSKAPRPPITLLFPIAEENGLHGSRTVRLSDLGHPVMGFNLDGQEPNEIVIGAMSALRWQAQIEGISAHAGLEPEKEFLQASSPLKRLPRSQIEGIWKNPERQPERHLKRGLDSRRRGEQSSDGSTYPQW